MPEQFVLRGHMKGHNGWVTSVMASPVDPTLLVSTSRDNTSLVWKVSATNEGENDLLNGLNYGIPLKSLTGHSHIVSDVSLSMDSQFAMTSSWDGTLRLWRLQDGTCTTRFVGHTKDVLSVAFSPDNRLIASGGRDRTIKLWSTVGDCVGSTDKGNHDDWVTCVRFSPDPNTSRVISGGYDKIVKVWDIQTCSIVFNLMGHTGYVSSVAVSPDGSMCASGGEDGTIILWELTEGRKLYELNAEEKINDIAFSPSRYWVAAATNNGIKVWDLESKALVQHVNPAFPVQSKRNKSILPFTTCVCWSIDGNVMYAGYSDHMIRLWAVQSV